MTHEGAINAIQRNSKMKPFAILQFILITITVASCAVKKRTEQNVSVAIKDTVYIERTAHVDKYSRDTLVIERVVTEYYPDTAGNWIPSRRSISEEKEVAVRHSAEAGIEKVSAAETLEMQAEREEEITKPGFSRRKWFLAGAITSLVLLLAAYMAKRIFLSKII